MTFEELTAIRNKAKEIELEALRMEDDAERRYIEERLPFPFKWYEKIIIYLEVTEATRNRLHTEARSMKKFALGRRYKKKGLIVGWYIGDDGEIRPSLYGMNSYYSTTDIIHSVKQDKQDPERCRDCRRCKNGDCYSAGGDTPTRKDVNDSYICGMFLRKIIKVV
jgi:hypothetical protein